MKIENYSMKSYDRVIELWKKAGISVGSSDTEDELEKMFQRNPELFLIGKEDEKLIAVVMGGFDGRRGYVHHLAVDPKYQKMGYGRQMMNILINRFINLGVHKIHLFIQKHNKKVFKFYKNLNWEIRDDIIMMSFIPDKDLYKMEI
jgi:ribosomal protein S18 acetylase RimI-like enzyme